MVYVGSRDGRIYAVDCDGNRKWEVATGGPISASSPALGPDGTVYVGSDDGLLYAIGEAK
jgi:outer membrane protein assembly factor BamB